MEPLSNWDDEKSKNPKVVWWGKLDERYLVEVVRINLERATLFIFDHKDQNRLLHQEDTLLSFGAVFGPDINDVKRWEDRVIEVVDMGVK